MQAINISPPTMIPPNLDFSACLTNCPPGAASASGQTTKIQTAMRTIINISFTHPRRRKEISAEAPIEFAITFDPEETIGQSQLPQSISYTPQHFSSQTFNSTRSGFRLKPALIQVDSTIPHIEYSNHCDAEFDIAFNSPNLASVTFGSPDKALI